MNTQTKTTKEQREAVGLLSIGTLLEALDMMLYIHMAVLLNDIFFQPADPLTHKFVKAFVFCTTFIFRPIGALFFGWLGDKIGRKPTLVITTMMMSGSCIAMAILPTYDQIGAWASWIVIIIRIVQGFATLGEISGAQIYIAETIKPPVQYFHIGLLWTFASLGAVCAIGIASLVTSHGFNWRYAFWAGSLVAVVGAIARTKLRETPEFIDAQTKAKNLSEKMGLDHNLISQHIALTNPKVDKKLSLSYLAIQCLWPLCYYFTYMHCADVLKSLFNFTPAQVIHQNFIIASAHIFSSLAICYVCYYINPLKISKILSYIFLCGVIICPYLLDHATSPFHILAIQFFFAVLNPTVPSSFSIFFKYLPTLKRFRNSAFLFALSRAFMHVITAYGTIFLVKWFGNIGLLVIMLPTAISFIIGLRYFEKLETEAGNYD